MVGQTRSLSSFGCTIGILSDMTNRLLFTNTSKNE